MTSPSVDWPASSRAASSARPTTTPAPAASTARAVTTAQPDLTDENTNRDERNRELYLRDRVALGAGTTAWLGLRHTRLHRESVRTDGSRQTDYSQGVTTPWVALSHALSADWLAYASWGQGVESEVAPNRSRYKSTPDRPCPRSRAGKPRSA